MASCSFIHAGQGGRGKGSQVLAAVTRSPGEMVVGDVTGPGRARAGHVIVRPERVGICGSDFHLFSGDVGALSGSRDFYPRIQGHEVSAIVEDPGDGEAAAGERVAILPLLPCGRCYPCRIGRPNVCPAFPLVGVHLDGGLAQRLWVPGSRDFSPGIRGHGVSGMVEDRGDGEGAGGERVAILPLLPCGRCYPCRIGRPNVCPAFRLVGVHLDGGLAERLEVPVGLVFGTADLDRDSACFVEPASVAVHALARGRLRAGEQVVVFGAGPIGLATLIAGTHAGARVLSVDPVPGRRDLAKRLGAEVVAWGSQPELAELTREWTRGARPPLIIETSGG